MNKGILSVNEWLEKIEHSFDEDQDFRWLALTTIGVLLIVAMGLIVQFIIAG